MVNANGTHTNRVDEFESEPDPASASNNGHPPNGIDPELLRRAKRIYETAQAIERRALIASRALDLDVEILRDKCAHKDRAEIDAKNKRLKGLRTRMLNLDAKIAKAQDVAAVALETVELADINRRHQAMKAFDLARYGKDFIHEHTGANGVRRLHFYRGLFLLYDGQCYQAIEKDDFPLYAYRWLERRLKEARPKHADELTRHIAAKMQITEDREGLKVPSKRDLPYWSGDAASGPAKPADWFAVANGIVSVTRYSMGEPDVLRPHTPQWVSLNTIPFNYDPTAICPRWLIFLNDVLSGDRQSIDTLQRWFGWALTADTSYQKFLLLYGKARSGKGTILRILKAMLGAHNVAAPSLRTLANDHGLTGLVGKTAALVGDAIVPGSQKGFAVLEVLKSIIGEDDVEVNPKNIDQKTMRLPIKFTISADQLPKFADPAGALHLRMLLLHFRKSYAGCEDFGLTEKLTAELPGILNWALRGLVQLRACGKFVQPPAGSVALGDFDRRSAPVKSFFEQCIDVDPAGTVLTTDLYKVYCKWSEEHGHPHTTLEGLGTLLRDLAQDMLRDWAPRERQPGLKRTHEYRGIKLAPGVFVPNDEWKILGRGHSA